jgi:peptidyl-prolyl cis-trans isomerase SurA
MMKLGTFTRAALTVAGTLAAAAAFAQTGGRAPASTDLILPTNVQFLDNDNNNIRKATAIVNGDVITETDVDQRMALIVAANGGQISPEEKQLLRQQVLRNLVDETLEIQEAASKDIKLEPHEIDAYYARWAESFHQTPVQFSAYLRTIGSSDGSIKRQIRGEMAWRRVQQQKIDPFISVSDEEVNAVIARLNASRGAQEYHVGEIFLSATPENAAQVRANLDRILEQLHNGASFTAYARQFSEASTAAVGGDLGWVRAEQLPEAIAQALPQIPVGQVSNPIAIPGGFSIIAIQDTRKVLVADARDAVLSLKQVSILRSSSSPSSPGPWAAADAPRRAPQRSAPKSYRAMT